MISGSRWPKRILDFDIETRRIGFFEGSKFGPSGCEPVIIAASWGPEDPVETRSLRSVWTEFDARLMLEWFVDLWERADVVTGHYIRKFDLPILNGCLFEWGYPPLSPKLTSDTQADIPKIGGLSKSQENLSEMLRIGSKKFHMNDTLWRSVARLTRDGLHEATTRVVDDVRQHQELRERLSGHWLKRAKTWTP